MGKRKSRAGEIAKKAKRATHSEAEHEHHATDSGIWQNQNVRTQLRGSHDVSGVFTAKLKNSLVSWFDRGWKTVTAFSVLVSACGIVFLRPQLKVAEAGPINPSLPASLTFTLSNDSVYTIKDVEYLCSYPMLLDQDGSIRYTNPGVSDQITAIESGESQKVDCRNGIATRVMKYESEPFAIIEGGPITTNKGQYTYTLGAKTHSFQLTREENTVRGLCNALNRYNKNAFAGYYGLVTYLPESKVTTGIYFITIVTPDPQMPVGLSDDTRTVIQSKSRRMIDIPIEEIRTLISITYRPWFSPIKFRQERYFASSRQTDGSYRFGPVSKSAMTSRVKRTDIQFNLTGPEQSAKF